MNFLQLSQAVRAECLGENYVGSATPTTVINQEGVLKKIVDKTRDAWVAIQVMHRDWTFLRAVKVHVLTINTRTYSIASAIVPGMGLTTFREVDITHPLENPGNFIEETSADKTALTYVPWEQFRRLVIPTTSARPTRFTVNLSSEIEFDRIPDKAYTVRIAHWTMAVELANDAESPVGIPGELHRVIVGRAVKLYAGQNVASELYQHGEAIERQYMPQLISRYLPNATHAFAQPIA